MARKAQAADKPGWKNPADAPDESITVDLDEKDDAKAIHRVKAKDDAELPAQEDSDKETPAERKWLDRDKAVKKRIGRLERSFSQQLAEIEARNQAEIAGLRDKLNGLNVGNQPTSDAAHEAAMEKLQEKLEKAHEDGDSKAIVALTREISKAENAYLNAKRAALVQDDGSKRREVPSPKKDTASRNGISQLGQKWISANEEWFTDPEFSVERAAATVIDGELMREGSDPEDPEHYEEIQRRLMAKFPDLDVQSPGKRKARSEETDDEDDDEDDQEQTRVQKRPPLNARRPVPSFQDHGQRPTRKPNGRQQSLTAIQVANMERFGLDPSNPRHVRQYAQEAFQGQAEGGRG